MPKTNEHESVPPVATAQDVPGDLRQVFLEIVSLTDNFCKERLNVEYKQLCREIAVAVCQPGSPVKRGKRASWACGIVYSLGWVNFLSDPSQEPHLRSEEIAKWFGVSVATMHNKSKEIREGLDLVPFDPDFTLPRRADQNPLIKMAEVTDLVTNQRRQASSEPTPKTDLVMQFKITLRHVLPSVWRRIQVKDCTFDRLHEHIQTAMGWTNSHLHHFEIERERYGDPALLDDGFEDFKCVDSTVTTLSAVVPENRKGFRFLYEYDFGDGWEHEIIFEGCPKAAKGAQYPVCLEGERACPPEDVGGVGGYEFYLEALADPEHEEHDTFMEWSGPFDPEAFDTKKATREMRKGLPNWREWL